jgi:hypothetical protein
MVFLDESGSISHDPFFAVGCLKLAEPSILLRQIQKLRDRRHVYHEIHFASITRLGRLALTSACRLDSKATDALQLVDLLTSAVTHDFRQKAKLAKARNPKGKLTAYVRRQYEVETFVSGCRKKSINVALYRDKH